MLSESFLSLAVLIEHIGWCDLSQDRMDTVKGFLTLLLLTLIDKALSIVSGAESLN